MEEWQKQHISYSQPILTKLIGSESWLILEIENKAELTNIELERLTLISNNLEKTEYLIEVLKKRPQGYKILLHTLHQNIYSEGLKILQDSFLPTFLQEMQIHMSEDRHQLKDIFGQIHIENLCVSMKTKLRPTEFARLLMKLTDERTLMLSVENSGNDDYEDISTKIEMIAALLKINPNLIHKKDIYGRTPLLAKRCNLHLIKYFVQEGADIYQTDDDGYTLVHMAAGWMSPDVFHELIKFLLMECKAKELFKWKDNMGNTSLHFALGYLSEIRVDTVRLILEETEINVNDMNRYGENLLYRAFLGGQNIEVLKFLLEFGAENKIKNQSLVNDFGGWGNAEAFMYFLRLGVDVFE